MLLTFQKYVCMLTSSERLYAHNCVFLYVCQNINSFVLRNMVATYVRTYISSACRTATCNSPNFVEYTYAI